MANPTTTVCDQTFAALNKIWESKFPSSSHTQSQSINRSFPLPNTSPIRLAQAQFPSKPQDQDQKGSEKTFLYLAYGSNLSAETFQGVRGIQPLSAINVHVPSLTLTFDLSGIPYTEPCFANSAYRSLPHPPFPPPNLSPLHRDSYENEKEKYHKNRWTKGLVGVVYEVTPEDYHTIIATEGGGSSYADILVPCFALPSSSNSTVPLIPSGIPFLAHTLLSPPSSRPHPDYAQASARYLKLITDGAAEHSLPMEYQKYLQGIRPYNMTTKKQRVGQALLLLVWGPVIAILIGLGKVLADEEGRIPRWLGWLLGMAFRAIWATYDGFWKGIFGDGERTMEEDSEMGK